MKQFLPLVLFVVLAYFLLDGLGRDTKTLPSPLIGKAFPNVEVLDFFSGERYFIEDKLRGKTTLVNIWASWCVACHAEHQMLGKIAKTGQVQMIGVNYKDDILNVLPSKPSGKKPQQCQYKTRDDTKFGDCFLQMRGNPFDIVVRDYLGKLGLELGVYRVPETFLVSDKGIIIFKHLGEITAEVWQNKFVPLL